jgi:voltage-gated potassium channel Kch
MGESDMKRMWREWRWVIMGALAMAALVLGYVGFVKRFEARGETRAAWDALYLSLQLFALESGNVEPPVSWELSVARWLAPTVAAYAAISALMVLFAEEMRTLRVRFLRDHVVICGLGEKGHRFAREFREDGYKVVVIEENENNARIEQCRQSGAVKVLFGGAGDESVLRRARVGHARYVLALCSDDSDNAEIARNVERIASEHKGARLTCLVHVSNLTLYRQCRDRALARKEGQRARIEFFNVFDAGARRILNEFPMLPGPEGEAPHVAIVGRGPMAESLLVNLAARWRERFAESQERLQITLVTLGRRRDVATADAESPLVAQTCALHPLTCERSTAGFSGLTLEKDVAAVFVCDEDEAASLAAVIQLRRNRGNHAAPVVMCVKGRAGFATLLGEDCGAGGTAALFGIYDRACTLAALPDGVNETLARLFHEEYAKAQVTEGRRGEGEAALLPWEELAEEARESNRLEADALSARLAAAGWEIEPLTHADAGSVEFGDDEVETMSRMEHERWRAATFLEGWRYGPIRDEGAKTNPDLAGWEEIPEELREYNREETRGLPALLARAGLQVRRA